MKYKIQLPVILFIISLIYNISIINLGVGPFDEGVMLVGAERILKGDIPNKDFFTVYPPGQIFTLAALFKVFGISIIVERIYDIILKSLLSISVFLVIRLLSSNKIALIGWVMSLVWVGYSSFPAYPVYPSLLFTYLSIYFFLVYKDQNRIHCIVLSAVSVVIAILFRHDLGGLAAIAIAVVLMLEKVIREQKSWVPLTTYVMSGIFAALPIFIYIYLNSAQEFMVNDLILWPMNVFPKYQGLPYPSLSRWNLPFYVFPLVLVFGIITALFLMRSNVDKVTSYGVLLISLIGIVFLNQVRVRSDIIHLLPVALTGILLAPVLLHTFLQVILSNMLYNRLIYLIFIAVMSITLAKAISNKIFSFPKDYVLESSMSGMDRARYIDISTDLKNTVAYIKDITQENEYIYVGLKNHDRLVFNYPIVYFLAERNCATKYHEFNPGHTNTLEIQNEIISELEDKSVRVVILTSTGWRYEPNLSSIDSKVELLDNYIRSSFKLDKKYGIYEIWIEKI